MKARIITGNLSFFNKEDIVDIVSIDPHIQSNLKILGEVYIDMEFTVKKPNGTQLINESLLDLSYSRDGVFVPHSDIIWAMKSLFRISGLKSMYVETYIELSKLSVNELHKKYNGNIQGKKYGL